VPFVLLLSDCQGGGHGGGEQAPAGAQAAGLHVAPDASAQLEPARHVLIVIDHDDTGFRVRHAQLVASPLPVKRFAETRQWRAAVEDSSGKSLFSAHIPVAGERRAEFAGPDGGMRAVHVQSEKFSFVLRVPYLERGTRVRFWEAQRELGVVPYPAEFE